MVNKYMNICSAFLVIRKLQIKAIRRDHYKFNRIAEMKNFDDIIYGKGMEKLEFSFIAGEKYKMLEPLWKTVGLFFIKFYHTLTI